MRAPRSPIPWPAIHAACVKFIIVEHSLCKCDPRISPCKNMKLMIWLQNLATSVSARKGAAKSTYPTPAALRKWLEKAPKTMTTEQLIDLASKILREPNIRWLRDLLRDRHDERSEGSNDGEGEEEEEEGGEKEVEEMSGADDLRLDDQEELNLDDQDKGKEEEGGENEDENENENENEEKEEEKEDEEEKGNAQEEKEDEFVPESSSSPPVEQSKKKKVKRSKKRAQSPEQEGEEDEGLNKKTLVDDGEPQPMDIQPSITI
jgi:hypothetical protein